MTPHPSGATESRPRVESLLQLWVAAGPPTREGGVEAFLRQHLPAGPTELADEFRRRVAQSGGPPPSDTPAGDPLDTPPGSDDRGPPATVGRYAVVKELGRGGMGRVLLARDPELAGRLVAVKVLGSDTHPALWERFREEAAALARLSHTHIVPVFDFGTDGGRPFFVMEYAERGSLKGHAAEPQLPADAARAVELVARAVAAAHDRGLLHRDLKPANVVLAVPADEPALNCQWGWPKVADFGLAKVIGTPHDLTASGFPLGSPAYMAPEQVRGDLAGHGRATDVYGLGTILYELLAARPPFPGPDPGSAILTREPDPPSRANPRVPPELDAICLRCLAKDPAARFPTATELADALAGWSRPRPASESVTVLAPPGPPSVLPAHAPAPPARRRRRPTVVVVAAAVALLVGLVAWRSCTPGPSGPESSGSPVPAESKERSLERLLDHGPRSSGSPAPPPRLGLDLLRWVPDTQSFELMADGATLRTDGDQYVIAARPATPGYLYVFQIDARNKVNWYFPKNVDGFSSGRNPVAGNVPVLVPPADRQTGLTLDANMGREQVFAVLAADRWKDLEDTLTAAIQSNLSVPVSGVVRGAAEEKPLAARPQANWKQHLLRLGDREVRAGGSYLQVVRWFNHE